MGVPPVKAGADHSTVARASPAVAVADDGRPGTVAVMVAELDGCVSVYCALSPPASESPLIVTPGWRRHQAYRTCRRPRSC